MNKDSKWVILWRQRYRLSFILKDGVCVAIYNKHFILSDRPRFWYWCVFVCIGFDFVLWNVNEFQLEHSFKVLEPSCKKVNLSDSWVALSHAIFYLHVQCMFTKIIKTDFSNTWTDWTLYTKCCYYFEYIGLKLKKSRLDRSKLEKEYLFTWVLNY